MKTIAELEQLTTAELRILEADLLRQLWQLHRLGCMSCFAWSCGGSPRCEEGAHIGEAHRIARRSLKARGSV